MSEVSFYNTGFLQKEKSISALSFKIYKMGLKLIIRVSNEESQEHLNKMLWVYSRTHFLPHGSSDDLMPELQPVYITTGFENPNNATVIMFTGLSTKTNDISNFSKAIYIFNENDEEELNFIRLQFKLHVSKGDNVIYWRQQEDGGWDKLESIKINS